MATLYVDRKEIELRADGNCVRLFVEGEPQRSVPLRMLDKVVVYGSARLNSGLLGWLAKHDVGLIALGLHDCEQVAYLSGRPRGDGRRRVAQYELYRDPEWRREWGRRTVVEKLKAQGRFLRQAARERPELRKELGDGARQVEEAARRARETEALTLAELMGLEGAAASGYFQAYRHLFAPSLGFEGRNRRPPRDPVNVCLSLGYTLTHYEAVRSIQAAGLDPFIGFYHDLAYSRESLACDLVEPARARVDAWVWGLFRERVLRPEHFKYAQSRCLMGKAGRREFYERFEPESAKARRRFRRWCAIVSRAISGRSGLPAEAEGEDEDAVS